MDTKKTAVLMKDQIRVLVAKDFKLKYNSTALGFLWSLIVPFLTGCVYYFVFGVLLHLSSGSGGTKEVMAKATPNFLLYLLCGTFLWQFFSNVVMMNGNVLSANGPLMKKTSFNRELLVWGTYFSEVIHFLLTIPILFLVMFCFGIMPDFLTIIPNLVVCMVSLTFFSMGLSYAYAACNLFFRDLERIVNIFMMLWMFCSPVFISVTSIPAKYEFYYYLNPMAQILRCWRDIFWSPFFVKANAAGIVSPEHVYYGLTHAWHPGTYLPMLVGAFATYFIGRWIFRKMEPAFAEMM